MTLRRPVHARRYLAIGFVLLAAACGNHDARNPGPEPCSAEWQQWVESRLLTGDGQGHGPDIGSDEWQSVVEFRLGVRGDPAVPARDTDEWCRFVDAQFRAAD